MTGFELNAITGRHIAELQAVSRNMALGRGFSGEPMISTASCKVVRRAGAALGRSVQAMHVPGVPSKRQPA